MFDSGSGTITLNLPVPNGTVIAASFVDADTGATISAGSLSASANGSANILIYYAINNSAFPGRRIYVRLVIGSSTIQSATYEPLIWPGRVGHPVPTQR